jgi:hypothetical protein
MKDLSEVAWQLLLSEIPFSIKSFTSRFLTVSVGMPNREPLATTTCLTPEEAAAFLTFATVQHYPKSDFTHWATLTRDRQYCATDPGEGLD